MEMLKRTISPLITIMILGSFAYGQNQVADLNGINYQAVAIDEDGKEIVGTDVEGKPLFEKQIGVRFTIDDGPGGSTTYYQDEHVTNTDKYGLFSLIIGHGANTGAGTYNSLLNIPWINGDQWLKVEIAIENDGNYRVVSHEKLMTVPYSFYTDDIADNSITTYKVVDEALQDVDIDTGAVTTSEIRDETIQAEDIDTGAVTTSEIQNETIMAEDIATGAVETSEILDGTILNEDIADGTIDLTSKVTGILPVENGGTGLNASGASAGQVLIGNGSGFDLDTLTAGTGIIITNTAGGIEIASGVTGVNSTSAGNVQIGDPGTGSCAGSRELAAGDTWISPSIPLPGVSLGNIIVGSVNDDLKGCVMSTYVTTANQIRVSIYNGTGAKVCFISNAQLRVLVVQ